MSGVYDFATVVVLEPGLAIFGAHVAEAGDEPALTRIIANIRGRWDRAIDLRDLVYAAARKPAPAPDHKATPCFVARGGYCIEIRSHLGPVQTQIDSKDRYIEAAAQIGGELFACGAQNQVYRQVDGAWVEADRGLYVPLAGDDGEIDFDATCALYGIDGFAADDVYAVGDQGVVWHWNGGSWSEVYRAQGRRFESVRCASTGEVYVGGGGGLLIAGRRGGAWRDLSRPDLTTSSARQLVEFRGTVYAAAGDSLLAITGDDVRRVDVPGSDDASFYAIDATADELWCAGGAIAFQFDGERWTRHDCPSGA